MSDDLLREATRAVRETTEDSGGSGAFTRMRIMHSLHGARRRRLTRVAVWAPLAAVLAGATAAAATGQVPRVWHAIEHAVLRGPDTADEPTPRPAKHKARGRSRAPTAAVDSAPEPVAALEPTAASDTQEQTAAEPVLHDRPRASDAVSVEPHKVKALRAASPIGAGETDATATPDAASSLPSEEDLAAARELALYRSAHRAHFRQHDCGAAVLAWERYLADAPRGRFTLEARYNRALCLVRLGREREAAAALRPFAQGSYGGYRQSDARALLQALESKDAGGR